MRILDQGEVCFPADFSADARRLALFSPSWDFSRSPLSILLAFWFLLMSTLPLMQELPSKRDEPSSAPPVRMSLPAFGTPATWLSDDVPKATSQGRGESQAERQGRTRQAEGARRGGLRPQAFIPIDRGNANSSPELRPGELAQSAAIATLELLGAAAVVLFARRQLNRRKPEEVTQLKFEERRKEPRMRTRHRVGVLLGPDRRAISECLVLDRSDHGARVRTPDAFPCLAPVYFVDGNECIMYQARVAWADGNEMGLELIRMRRVHRARYWPSQAEAAVGRRR